MKLASIIYEAIYDYCSAVFTRRSVTIQLVQAHQDAPAPNFPYIAIELVNNLDKVGQDEREVTNSAGVVSRKSVYTGNVKIWQVGGEGEHLRELMQDLQRRDCTAALDAANLVIFNTPAIQMVPRIDDQLWIKEYFAELPISIAVEDREDLGWIERVEVNDNYIGGL